MVPAGVCLPAGQPSTTHDQVVALELRRSAELRLKESDRLEGVTELLRGMGVRVRSGPDWLRVRGVPSRPRGAAVDADGDHRLAILGAVAGLASRDGVAVEGAEAAAVSFPGFYELLDSVSTR